MPTNETLAAQLRGEADKREAEAKQLRKAAAVLLGESAEATPNQTPPSAPMPRGSAGISAESYMEVISASPEKAWEPPTLLEAMVAAGHNTNVESVRTMLYRLEKRGLLAKVGRGAWRAARPPLGLVSAAQPGS